MWWCLDAAFSVFELEFSCGSLLLLLDWPRVWKIGFLPLAPERVFNHIDPLKG